MKRKRFEPKLFLEQKSTRLGFSSGDYSVKAVEHSTTWRIGEALTKKEVDEIIADGIYVHISEKK